MYAFSERQAICRYLDNRDIAFGAEIAREALGQRYADLNAADRQRITGHLLRAGWRRAKVHGHSVFVAPRTQPKLPL